MKRNNIKDWDGINWSQRGDKVRYSDVELVMDKSIECWILVLYPTLTFFLPEIKYVYNTY